MGKTYPWPVKVIVCISLGLALYFWMSDSEEDTSSDASAQFERGLSYYCGDGVPVDYSKAVPTEKSVLLFLQTVMHIGKIFKVGYPLLESS
jgi:hypothetical protein